MELLEKQFNLTGLGNSDNDYDEDEEISPNTSDNTLRNLIDAYNNAQSSKSRKEILSIFAQNFKRKQLKDLIPGLKDFRIKEARKHCKEQSWTRHCSAYSSSSQVLFQ